jgi:hypothetical protein
MPLLCFWLRYVTKLSAELQRDLDMNLLPNGKIIYGQVDTCKDQIAAALETLRPTSSWETGLLLGRKRILFCLTDKVLG